MIYETNLAMWSAAEVNALGVVALAAWMFFAGLFCGIIGAFIGMLKRRAALGLFTGMLLGPIGWLCVIFADEGQEEEGFGTLLSVLFHAAVANVLIASCFWLMLIRPMIDAAQAEEARIAQEAREREETARAEAARAEAARRAAAEASGAVMPNREPEDRRWSGYRNPLDGRPGGNLPRISKSVLPTPAPAPRPLVTPRPTPSPAQIVAEIERKYGARR